MSNLKLVLELVSAQNLMPQDVEGSASSFVQLHFDGQKFHSSVKEKDLNPVWNESFCFNITDPSNLPNLTLEASVYHDNKSTQSRAFLGRVCLNGTSFVSYSDVVVLHYPLEKKGMFSGAKGELGLKVDLTDDPSIRSSNPVPDVESFPNDFCSSQPPQVLELPNPNPIQIVFSTPFPDTMSNLKLGVELLSAQFLMPKYNEGSPSSFVEFNFDSQKFCSTVKEKDMNPVWNESFYFNIYEPDADFMNLTLSACVLNYNKATHSRSYLGSIRLNGTSFVPYSDAVVLLYPLNKFDMFSCVKGELGLKVYVTDDPSLKSSNPLLPPYDKSFPNSDSCPSQPRVQEPAITSDLVGQMQFLFVLVVDAHDLPNMDISGSLDQYVEMRVGNDKGITRDFEKNRFHYFWNRQAFGFSRDQMQSSVLEVIVKTDLIIDDFIGIVRFDINGVPTQVSPNGPPAREWYQLEDEDGEKTKGELMLAVWIGTLSQNASSWSMRVASCWSLGI